MIPQPLICVADVEAASAWFQRVLGLQSAHGGNEYERLTADGQLVLQLHAWDVHEHPHLGSPGTRPYGNGVVLWFQAADAAQAFERALATGAEVLEPLHVNTNANHLEFWLREPNGYVIVVAGPSGVVSR